MDDSNSPPEPRSILCKATRGNPLDPTAMVRVSDGTFAGGDLENNLFIDESDFAWQDNWTLSQGPNAGEQLLQVHDSSTGSVVDTFALYGANLPSVSWLQFFTRS